MILAELSGLQASSNHQRGNAMIYVLVAIALFGILTATLSSQNNQSDGQDIDDEMVALYANELIEYAAAAKNVVDQMIMTGSTIDDLDFINPTSAGFDTAPHIHKVFHPQGGGLNYQETFSEKIKMSPGSGWRINTITNVEWTASTANELILSAYQIPDTVCQAINQKITGNTTIPTLTLGALSTLFDPDSSPEDFDIVDCPACEGYPTLCVIESGLEDHGFYSILAGR